MKSWIALLFWCLSFSLLNAQTTLPNYVPSNNLVAYYLLDGDVKNAVDTTLHQGTATNATITGDRFNQIHKAYYLNGTNAFLTIPASVMNQVTGAFTVSIWHFIDSTFTHRPLGYELIADRDQNTWLYRFRIGYGYNTPPRFNMDSSYFDRIAGSNFEPRFAAQNPNIDSWTHFVYAFSPDSGGTIIGYIDGQLVGRRINSGNVPNGRQINVGHAIYPGSGSNGGGHVKGIVDEIGIWNRTLTAAEVQQLYTSCEIQITASPQNTTSTIGGTVNFNVSVATPGVSYQWQMDTTGQGLFQPLSASSQFIGVDSSSLFVQNISRNFDQARFRCLILGSVCQLYSEIAQLNVNCPVVISQQPSSTAAREGDTVLFSTNQISNASYMWQANLGNGFINLSNTGLITGVNTSQLRILGISMALNNALIRCVVNYEGCVDTSSEAQITVNCASPILSQPNDANVVAASQVQFEVQGTTGATFSWQRNQGFGFMPLSDGGQIQGAQTPILTLNNVGFIDDQNQFKCIVSTSSCSDTSNMVYLNIIGGVSVEVLNTTSLKIFPNPANLQLTIEFDDVMTNTRLNVLDAQGRLVMQSQLEKGLKSKTIDISELAEGLYLIQTDTETKRFLIKR